MPDICCTVDDNSYFFELAEVVPKKQAEELSTKGFYSTGFPDPNERGSHAMVNIIRQKQHKKYETGGAPVDLILYFNKDFSMYLPDIEPSVAGPSEIDLALEECKQRGPFVRIWSYCSWKDEAKRLA